MGTSENGITVSDDPLGIFKGADAVIDFTTPKATIEHARLAVESKIVHVIGTTGMDDSHLNLLGTFAKEIPIIRAGNMSLGVNLLTLLTKKISAVLDEDFDIEIVESHHRHKVDAPSGTALMLGHAAAEGRGVKLLNVEDRGRDGITGARTRGDIGFHAIRGGDVVGEHDVIFAADGERIVLRHLATDRQIFVRGALRAAIWAQDKDAGEYDMMDVLGL
jgi:4-hydroxy-tetrahydrodipicolinate reductase